MDASPEITSMGPSLIYRWGLGPESRLDRGAPAGETTGMRMVADDAGIDESRTESLWPYLAAEELAGCFGPGELEEVKGFAHRVGRDYVTALRLVLGPRRLHVLEALIHDLADASEIPRRAQEVAREIRRRRQSGDVTGGVMV